MLLSLNNATRNKRNFSILTHSFKQGAHKEKKGNITRPFLPLLEKKWLNVFCCCCWGKNVRNVIWYLCMWRCVCDTKYSQWTPFYLHELTWSFRLKAFGPSFSFMSHPVFLSFLLNFLRRSSFVLTCSIFQPWVCMACMCVCATYIYFPCYAISAPFVAAVVVLSGGCKLHRLKNQAILNFNLCNDT